MHAFCGRVANRPVAARASVECSVTFSDRSKLDAEHNLVTRALAARRQRGEPVVDLTLSNPTVAGLTYDGAAILASIASENALLYAPEPFGLVTARAAVCELYAALGVRSEVGRTLLTASTSEAYAYAFKLLCDAGDEVLVPAPSYPLLEHLARLEQVTTRSYALVYDGRWQLDLDSVRRAVTSATRAIVVVQPNNPTGSFLAKSELAELASFGLPIISDEVFGCYGWTERKDAVKTLLECDDTLVLALDGLSKRAALPQLKLAWTTLAGPPVQVRAALSRLEHIADTFLSPGTPVQLALPALLAAGKSTQRAILQRVSRNYQQLPYLLHDTAASALHAEGGWYAILRLPQTLSEEQWVLYLLEEGVWVQPGFFYDFENEAYVVISLLTPESDFDAGVGLLARAVTRAVGGA